MAGLDSANINDSTVNAASNDTLGARLSLEANGGPQDAGTPAQQDRGHAAHAGNDHGTQPPSRPTFHGIETTTPGIDVSEFQKNINWEQVQKSGVQFAYIRATDGTTIQDANFAANWQGAEKAGVLVGPYHFFTTTSPVQSQIDNFVDTVKKVDAGNLPPVLDVEDPAQFANFTVAQRVDMIQQWLDGVQNALGVQPMLYMSSNFSATVLNNAPQFDKYKLWVADYSTALQPVVPQPWTSWNFWQHSDKGVVPGITGAVDLDFFNGPANKLPVSDNNVTK